MARKTLAIGSVSWGTMREEDLIPRFISALEKVNKKLAVSKRAEYKKLFRYADSKAIQDLYIELFDLLDAYTPPYCYFGAHEGDGSDFGCWPEV